MTALFGPTDAIDRAHVLREAGASGVFTFEGPHDVFTPLALAAAVEDLDLMTNVAIAFPRNPIHLAHQANDLQLLTKGRFTLGLGTQVRTQIEKRFGAEFDRPVVRMTELVRALRAIFAAWNSGDRLDFRGHYYRHTLMTPTFSPGPNPYGSATDLRRCARAAVDPRHRQDRRRSASHAVRLEAVPARGDNACGSGGIGRRCTRRERLRCRPGNHRVRG